MTAPNCLISNVVDWLRGGTEFLVLPFLSAHRGRVFSVPRRSQPTDNLIPTNDSYSITIIPTTLKNTTPRSNDTTVGESCVCFIGSHAPALEGGRGVGENPSSPAPCMETKKAAFLERKTAISVTLFLFAKARYSLKTSSVATNLVYQPVGALSRLSSLSSKK